MAKISDAFWGFSINTLDGPGSPTVPITRSFEDEDTISIVTKLGIKSY